jgi:hypothetical protein
VLESPNSMAFLESIFKSEYVSAAEKGPFGQVNIKTWQKGSDGAPPLYDANFGSKTKAEILLMGKICVTLGVNTVLTGLTAISIIQTVSSATSGKYMNGLEWAGVGGLAVMAGIRMVYLGIISDSQHEALKTI